LSTALQDVLSQVEACERALAAAPTEAALRQAYAQYGGREGTIKRAVSAAIAAAEKADKRELGQVGNTALQRIEAAFEARLAQLASEARGRDLGRRVDVTLLGRRPPIGHLHPLTHTRREIERIFAQLGFALATGPQVEGDFYNFEALAMPKDHPARDMQDTFYVDGAPDVLLRTHTSPVQIRTMLAQAPPVRVIIPGTVYRRDDDPTHSPMFHQVEGLVVDTDVTFADLKGTLLHFVRAFFGREAGIRLRPSFFPFTEPSAEVDATCVFCAGAGKLAGGAPCRTCKTTGWMELGGAGMVDPEVFRHVAYDAEKYTGFAFGFGIDRMAMLKYHINDIGLLYQGDVRFLEQF
jgi:phenylalanyl-tRNA synthetase alpha chain